CSVRGCVSRAWGSCVARALAMLHVFAVVIWFLAAYMQAGSRAEVVETRSLQLRVLAPIVWPFKRFFNAVFDGAELIAATISRGVGRLAGRADSDSLSGARAATGADRVLLLRPGAAAARPYL